MICRLRDRHQWKSPHDGRDSIMEATVEDKATLRRIILHKIHRIVKKVRILWRPPHTKSHPNPIPMAVSFRPRGSLLDGFSKLGPA